MSDNKKKTDQEMLDEGIRILGKTKAKIEELIVAYKQLESVCYFLKMKIESDKLKPDLKVADSNSENDTPDIDNVTKLEFKKNQLH